MMKRRATLLEISAITLFGGTAQTAWAEEAEGLRDFTIGYAGLDRVAGTFDTGLEIISKKWLSKKVKNWVLI